MTAPKVTYRKAKYTDGPNQCGYFTAGIDASCLDFRGDPDWHLHAIEFHSKDKAEAERRRDEAFAAMEARDPVLTPRNFLNDILSACDASNWDADRNTGDYFNGLRDAYEAIQEIAIEYQTAIYAWTDVPPSRPAKKA